MPETINSKPLVSIITICRNSEKTISKTIESVKNQTYKNIEYIIIDGKSEDRTIDIVHSYKDNISKIIRGLNSQFKSLSKFVFLISFIITKFLIFIF